MSAIKTIEEHYGYKIQTNKDLPDVFYLSNPSGKLIDGNKSLKKIEKRMNKELKKEGKI